MKQRDFLKKEEEEWTSKHSEVINYKDYLPHLPQNLFKILETKVPIAFHTFLPPNYVSKAIAVAVEKSNIVDEEYIIRWYADTPLVLSIKLFATSNSQIICVFQYLKNTKETVILISSNDVVMILSQVEDILDQLRENIDVLLNKKQKKIDTDATVINITEREPK